MRIYNWKGKRSFELLLNSHYWVQYLQWHNELTKTRERLLSDWNYNDGILAIRIGYDYVMLFYRICNLIFVFLAIMQSPTRFIIHFVPCTQTWERLSWEKKYRIVIIGTSIGNVCILTCALITYYFRGKLRENQRRKTNNPVKWLSWWNRFVVTLKEVICFKEIGKIAEQFAEENVPFVFTRGTRYFTRKHFYSIRSP